MWEQAGYQRMALFMSTYGNKVDGKGRVSVPASFRASAQKSGYDGIILFQSPTFPCLEGTDLAFMQRMSDRLGSQHGPFDEPALVAGGVDLFSVAKELSFDSNGRVVLPTELRDLAGIEEQATFVGQGPKFQLWSTERFDAERAKATTARLDTLKNIKPLGGSND